MTPAATLDAMMKAANASAHIRTPTMQKAIAQLGTQYGMRPDQRSILAAQVAEKAGLRLPVISPEVHANLVNASGLSNVADRVLKDWPLARISERTSKQLREGFVASGISDQVVARWTGQLDGIIRRSGIGDQLTATMREGLADLYRPSPLLGTSWAVPAGTVEALRSLDQDSMESVIEVAADDLANEPAELAGQSPVELIRRSAGSAALGWAFVQAYCAQPGPPDISPDLQMDITLIVTGWGVFGIVLPAMLWLASRTFPDR